MNSKNPRGICDLVKLDGSEELIAKTQEVSVISRSLLCALMRKCITKKKNIKKQCIKIKIKTGNGLYFLLKKNKQKQCMEKIKTGNDLYF